MHVIKIMTNTKIVCKFQLLIKENGVKRTVFILNGSENNFGRIRFDRFILYTPLCPYEI
jgi:hypothetical protein